MARLNSVDLDTLKNSFPKLRSGFHGPHTVAIDHKLMKPGAEPFSLKTPQQVALPLMPKVKKERQHMERIHQPSGGAH